MLGAKIKAIRMKKGMTQEMLAEKLNVVRQTVSKWEKGVSVPDAVTLQRIAEILEVDVSCLLESEVLDGDSKNESAGQLSEVNEHPVIRKRLSGRRRKIIFAVAAAACVLFVMMIVLHIPKGAGSANLVPAKPITEARAKELALQDMGLQEEAVVFDSISYVESEDEGNYYEICFTYEDKKYEYRVFDGEVFSGGIV